MEEIMKINWKEAYKDIFDKLNISSIYMTNIDKSIIGEYIELLEKQNNIYKTILDNAKKELKEKIEELSKKPKEYTYLRIEAYKDALDLLEKEGASVSIKRKVVGQYFYKCDDCSKVIKCYVDERLTKEQRPTPFMDTCPCCKGTIKDNFGYITLSNIEEIEIKEFNKDIPIAVYLLTDADLKNYKDMACGNLHIVKNGKLVSVHK